MTSNQQSNTEAIELARRFFMECHRTWARPMVVVLDKMKPRLALQWAILVFQESLSRRRKSGSEIQQRKWLDDLMALMERSDVADYCDKFAFEVWSNDSIMNAVERGIARLYWAFQQHLQARTKDYYFQVTSAVGMLADNENFADAMDEPTLERAITIFRRLTE